jgi:uncharacterized UBP type Zn finger protein
MIFWKLNIFCHFSRLAIDVTKPCRECDTAIENWLCLLCFDTLCGRYINEHMLLHFISTEHPLTLSFSDLSVWCYSCNAYIDNPLLYKYKNLAHLSKFGEELVWSYGQDNIELQLNLDSEDRSDDSDGWYMYIILFILVVFLMWDLIFVRFWS